MIILVKEEYNCVMCNTLDDIYILFISTMYGSKPNLNNV